MHLSLLVRRYVPTKVIRLRNPDKPWFDDKCWRTFGLKQGTHLQWTCYRSMVIWKDFVCCRVRANETCSEAMRQFGVRNGDVLINAQSFHY